MTQRAPEFAYVRRFREVPGRPQQKELQELLRDLRPIILCPEPWGLDTTICQDCLQLPSKFRAYALGEFTTNTSISLRPKFSMRRNVMTPTTIDEIHVETEMAASTTTEPRIATVPGEVPCTQA